MAKSSKSTRQGVTIGQANAMIARLSRQHVRVASDRENLDRPVDSDIQITPVEAAGAHYPAYRFNLMVEGGDTNCDAARLASPQAASWCTFIDYPQQVGPCVLKMGGLAGVGTHNDHRFKGYARRVMENSLRWLRRQGYEVAMLYGISGFYPKFGYAEAFPDVAFSVNVRDAELARPSTRRGLKFVDFDAQQHLKAVLAMYRANNAGRTGPIRRSETTWRPFKVGVNWGSTPTARVALDWRGRPLGYFVFDVSADATVLEVGHATPAVFGDLLLAAAKEAWALRVEKVRFLLPEDDEFMAFCGPFGLRKEVACRRDGGAMVRLVNIPAALKKLSPLLAARLAAAPGAARQGRLTLRTNLDDVCLTWSRGRLTVAGPAKQGPAVKLPQWALAQLIYGYRDVHSMCRGGDLSGARAGLEILSRLFPHGPHYHYKVDKF